MIIDLRFAGCVYQSFIFNNIQNKGQQSFIWMWIWPYKRRSRRTCHLCIVGELVLRLIHSFAASSYSLKFNVSWGIFCCFGSFWLLFKFLLTNTKLWLQHTYFAHIVRYIILGISFSSLSFDYSFVFGFEIPCDNGMLADSVCLYIMSHLLQGSIS